MKILILGATGMLGHKLLQRLSCGHEVWGTIRGHISEAPEIQGIDSGCLIGEVDATHFGSILRCVETVSPDVVINCIGIVKQIDAAKDAVTSISINALLPHQLADLCTQAGARFIHFSTDCVFSGRAGPYRENDLPDPTDLYGRSKLLGEVNRTDCLTIRTSIVGRELRRGTGLFEWFYSQRGKKVQGYSKALYSGLTTLAMADTLRYILECHPDLSGIWQIGGNPIDKCSLLKLFNRVYGLGVHIETDETFLCDRRLDSSCFRQFTGWSPPSWESMVEAMHADPLL
ncbi:dTDP-4-dehydrorhamnose reductase family protein [Desulfogranum japonicum]|uniref:dTDP-4-dehydrorhamnose reductase family protein n=1 Tax=Desulfogranum japonicum TaxID=231447 RepID=UPI0003FA2AA5|nr:SDR family oxidoreductase [Desulfogranum japonicum]